MPIPHTPPPIEDEQEDEQFARMRPAAAWLGISRQRVHQLIEGGRIQALRRDGRWLIAETELLRFARERGLQRDVRELHAMILENRAAPRRSAEMTRLYASGESISAIAQRFGVCYNTVSGAVRRSGIRPTPLEARQLKRQRVMDALPSAMVEEIVRRYQAGDGCQSIARAMGWGYKHDVRVHAVLQSHNVVLRDKSAALKARWEQRRQQEPRFSQREVAVFVHRYQAGESCRSIAAEQGCSPTTLRRRLLEQDVVLRDKLSAIRATWKRRQSGETSPSAPSANAASQAADERRS